MESLSLGQRSHVWGGQEYHLLGWQEYHLGVHQESDLGGCRRDCVGVMCDGECRGGGAEGEEEGL